MNLAQDRPSRADVKVKYYCREVAKSVILGCSTEKRLLQLIDLQMQVFGQRSPLTLVELEDFSRRAERIKLLGQELDRVGITGIQHVCFRKAS